MPNARPITPVKPNPALVNLHAIVEQFSVRVTTGTVDYGGTDANVYFIINGHPFFLNKPKHDDFEKGGSDTYTFSFRIPLDELLKAEIQIGHDNTDDDAGWYCETVSLYVKLKGESYNRLYKRWPQVGWLAVDENNGETWANLQAGNELADRLARRQAVLRQLASEGKQRQAGSDPLAELAAMGVSIAESPQEGGGSIRA